MLVESGEPHVLLQHNSGIFSGMVEQTGPNSSTHLKEVARAASVTRVASKAALQMHMQKEQLQERLRLHSEVLGRRYVDNPVLEEEGVQRQHVQQQQQRASEGGDEQPRGDVLPYGRMDSGISRYGLQVSQQQLAGAYRSAWGSEEVCVALYLFAPFLFASRNAGTAIGTTLLGRFCACVHALMWRVLRRWTVALHVLPAPAGACQCSHGWRWSRLHARAVPPAAQHSSRCLHNTPRQRCGCAPPARHVRRRSG